MTKLNIQDFCELTRRYTVKFEHDYVCNLKKDLNENIDLEKWAEMFKEYYVNRHYIDNIGPEKEQEGE